MSKYKKEFLLMIIADIRQIVTPINQLIECMIETNIRNNENAMCNFKIEFNEETRKIKIEWGE